MRRMTAFLPTVILTLLGLTILPCCGADSAAIDSVIQTVHGEWKSVMEEAPNVEIGSDFIRFGKTTLNDVTYDRVVRNIFKVRHQGEATDVVIVISDESSMLGISQDDTPESMVTYGKVLKTPEEIAAFNEHENKLRKAIQGTWEIKSEQSTVEVTPDTFTQDGTALENVTYKAIGKTTMFIEQNGQFAGIRLSLFKNNSGLAVFRPGIDTRAREYVKKVTQKSFKYS